MPSTCPEPMLAWAHQAPSTIALPDVVEIVEITSTPRAPTSAHHDLYRVVLDGPRKRTPSHLASRTTVLRVSISRSRSSVLGDTVVTESIGNLLALSDQIVGLIESSATIIVTVHSGGRWPSSGIHWRSGVIVTAEETLERDENIELVLPGGRKVEASLAGRDPTTDVAVLRFQPDGLPSATTADAPSRAGQIILAVGSQGGGPIAALGIVAFAGGAWRSMRGGTIDSLLRLDLALSPVSEGGAIVDLNGRVIGMTVLGPRRRVLAIPTATIDRSVDQLLAKGHVFRGYLGTRLQSLRQRGESGGSQSSASPAGILVVSIDAAGPSARAGLLIGDIITTWNGKPVSRVREIMDMLGPDSVGSSVDLGLLRGGSSTALKVAIGERSIS
jgi:S1-C subfamily serine protease